MTLRDRILKALAIRGGSIGKTELNRAVVRVSKEFKVAEITALITSSIINEKVLKNDNKSGANPTRYSLTSKGKAIAKKWLAN